MTLEEFRATGVEKLAHVSDTDILDNLGCMPGTKVRVYEGGLCLEVYDNGTFGTTVCNESYEGTLKEIEAELYSWYIEEYCD
jgi:hypothetical protein